MLDSSVSGFSSKPNGRFVDSGCGSESKPKGSCESLGVGGSDCVASTIGTDSSSPHAGQGASVETKPQMAHSCMVLGTTYSASQCRLVDSRVECTVEEEHKHSCDHTGDEHHWQPCSDPFLGRDWIGAPLTDCHSHHIGARTNWSCITAETSTHG